MPTDSNTGVIVAYRAGAGPLADLRLVVLPGDHGNFMLELSRGGDSTVLSSGLGEREARLSARRIAELLGLGEVIA